MSTRENGFPIGAHHWLPDMAEETEDGVKPELPVWQFVLKWDDEEAEDSVWEIRTWFRRRALEEFQRDDIMQNLADKVEFQDVQLSRWEQVGRGWSRHDVAGENVVYIDPHEVSEPRITEENLDQYHWSEWPDEFDYQKPSWAS